MDAVEPDPVAPGPAPGQPIEPAMPEPVERVEPAEPAEPEAVEPEAVEAVETIDPGDSMQPPDLDLDLVELALASVELSAEGVQPAVGTVALVDMVGGGRLDIVMARSDAALVQEAIAGIAPPRPRTHDLLLATVAALGGAVDGVTLVERRAGGLYVANLRVRRPDGTTVDLDARPSDALNVALRSTGAVLRAARTLVEVPAD